MPSYNIFQEVVGYAPQHLLKLEYLVVEDVLKQKLQDIEAELMAEQHAYNTNSEDLTTVLKRHRVSVFAKILHKKNICHIRQWDFEYRY